MEEKESLNYKEVSVKLSERDILKFKSEQNLPRAIIVGAIVAVAGAILWGAITVLTQFQIGYMAIAIGAGVGFSMRFAGKGIDLIFGVLGALFAVLSCLLGNFFSVIGFIANLEGLGYYQTLTLFDYSQLIPIMKGTFNPIDLLFYGIAAFEGYKFAFRKFTEKDFLELEK